MTVCSKSLLSKSIISELGDDNQHFIVFIMTLSPTSQSWT